MRRLTHNFGLKLFSLVLACLLWLFIMNYQDPNVTRTISNIPITIENENIIHEAGKSYSVSGSRTLSVRVTARNSVLRELTADDFVAKADLSRLYDVTGQVPVEVSCPSGKLSSSQYIASTSSLKVTVEEVLRKNFAVQINVSGSLADAYRLGELTSSPAQVTVTAPLSVIEKIARVAATVNVSELTQNTVLKAELEYYNEAGTLLKLDNAKDTSFSRKTVDISVEVLETTTIPIIINVGDRYAVAPGYRYTGATQSISMAQVSGLPSRLAELTVINIPEEDLSVAGADTNVSVTLNVADYLPEGVELLEGAASELKVVLKVEKLQVKSFEVDTILLKNRSPELEYALDVEKISLSFRALAADFTNFKLSEVSAFLNMDGLAPGEYDLIPMVECDNVFEVLPVPTIHVVVTDPNEVPEETTAEPETDEFGNPIPSETEEPGGSADAKDPEKDPGETLPA